MDNNEWPVRIYDLDRPGFSGAGCLFDVDRVLTCAHVIAKISDVGRLRVAFPNARNSPDPFEAHVEVVGRWKQGQNHEGDLAVLRLRGSPGVRPARFARRTILDADPGELVAQGFPLSKEPEGRLARLALTARTRLGGGDWVQLESIASPTVVGGYSGAAVYLRSTSEVVGIITQADPKERLSRMIPVSQLVHHWDDLADFLPLGPFPIAAHRELRRLLAKVQLANVHQCYRTAVDDLHLPVEGLPDGTPPCSQGAAYAVAQHIAEELTLDEQRLRSIMGRFCRQVADEVDDSSLRNSLLAWAARYTSDADVLLTGVPTGTVSDTPIGAPFTPVSPESPGWLNPDWTTPGSVEDLRPTTEPETTSRSVEPIPDEPPVSRLAWWRRRSRDGQSKRQAGRSELVIRFAETCPVCAAALGKAAEQDRRTERFLAPPALRLEVGSPDSNDRYPWRVSAVHHEFRSAVSNGPPFSEHAVEYVYLLCSGGHIFPDLAPVLRGSQANADGWQRIDTWNMVAMVGAPAGGKTYLLLRTLSQNLNPESWSWDNDRDELRLRRLKLSPLEDAVFTEWAKQYGDTVFAGRAIPPNLTSQIATPASLLEEELPEALQAIKELIRLTVVDGERQAQDWGSRFRQPLVLRTVLPGNQTWTSKQTWTGAVELPGELFLPGGRSVRESVKLRAYDTLIWVIDPVVAVAAFDEFAADSLAADDDSYDKVLDGSLRPGATVQVGPELVRTNRDQIQLEIGQHLAKVQGLFTVDERSSLQLLVTVTKCDLIHTVLIKSKKLADLGEPGAVERGVVEYLSSLVNRWARGDLDADEATTRLLHYLHVAEAVDPSVRHSRILQISTGLLGYYSREDTFWNLVHKGDPDVIEIPAGTGAETYPWTINVPSIDTHLDQSLALGSAARLHLRDLVMSALGCGVAYGLGHKVALFEILRERWVNLRFFLCSPLGTVPVALDEYHLGPRDSGKRFPRAGDRSAALTQLLLSVLGKARR